MKVVCFFVLFISFQLFSQEPTWFSRIISKIDQLIVEQPDTSFYSHAVEAYRAVERGGSNAYGSLNLPSSLYDSIKEHYVKKALETINKDGLKWKLISERSKDPSRPNLYHDYLVLDDVARNGLENELSARSSNIIREASLELRSSIKKAKTYGSFINGIGKGIGASVIAVPVLGFAQLLMNVGGAFTYPFNGSAASLDALLYALPGVLTAVGSMVIDYSSVYKKKSINKRLSVLRSQVDALSVKYGEQVIKDEIKKAKEIIKKKKTYKFLRSASLFKENGQTILRFKIPANLWGSYSHAKGINELKKLSLKIKKYNTCNGKFM